MFSFPGETGSWKNNVGFKRHGKAVFVAIKKKLSKQDRNFNSLNN